MRKEQLSHHEHIFHNFMSKDVITVEYDNHER